MLIKNYQVLQNYFKTDFWLFRKSNFETCKMLLSHFWLYWVLQSANVVIEKTSTCIFSNVSQYIVFWNCYLFSYPDGEEKTYGGCEGPDAMYVKLISSDGHEFIVKREHALTSGTIKAMLSGPGRYRRLSTFIFFVFIFGHFEFLSCSK